MIFNDFLQLWMKRCFRLGQSSKQFLENVLHTRHMNRQLNRSILGLLKEVFSFVIKFNTISSIHERVQHICSNFKVLQVSRVDLFNREDHRYWFSKRKNNFSLLGEILKVASLWLKLFFLLLNQYL